MATVADDIAAISADSAQLATDQAAVVTAQAVLASAQATVAADTSTRTAADGVLSTALQTAGPAFIVEADGTASVYTFSTLPPGYVITAAKPAGSLPG